MTYQLVDARAIAARLGVKPRTIHMWRRRHPDFPDPVVTIAGRPAWEWPPVEKWASETGRTDV